MKSTDDDEEPKHRLRLLQCIWADLWLRKDCCWVRVESNVKPTATYKMSFWTRGQADGRVDELHHGFGYFLVLRCQHKRPRHSSSSCCTLSAWFFIIACSLMRRHQGIEYFSFLQSTRWRLCCIIIKKIGRGSRTLSTWFILVVSSSSVSHSTLCSFVDGNYSHLSSRSGRTFYYFQAWSMSWTCTNDPDP